MSCCSDTSPLFQPKRVLYPYTEQNLSFQVGNRALVRYNHTRQKRG